MVARGPGSSGPSGAAPPEGVGAGLRGHLFRKRLRDSPTPCRYPDAMDHPKVALVSGGAGGIGAAISLALARAGRRVLVAGRRAEACEALCARIAGEGGAAAPVQLDLTNPEAIARVPDLARDLLGGPVLELVNNAGIAESAPLLPRGGSADEVHRRHLEVNYHGARRLFEALLPEMLAAGQGAVVQVASSAALQGYAYVSAYSASKHALLGYTRSAALELAPRQVRLSVVCPHYVDSPMTDASVANIMEKTGKPETEVRDYLAKQNPGGVLVQPEEVAAAVLRLLEEPKSGVVLELLGGGEREVEAGVPVELPPSGASRA